MSTTSNPAGGDAPHENPAEPPPTVGPSGPDTTFGGTSAFLSARTNAGAPSGTASSASSGEHTSSNNHPSGLSVKVMMDQSGRHYVVHPESGLRFDIEDDPTILVETPYYGAALPSGHVPQMVPGSKTLVPGEKMLDTLMLDLGVQLTPEQQLRYSSVRGMLSTGRSTLLSTTSFLSEQRAALDINIRAIEAVCSETEAKLLDIHHRVELQEDRVDQCLEESLKALRAFGSTKSQLEQLTLSMTSYNNHTSPQPGMGIILPSRLLRPELDLALPPKSSTEIDEAYHRCAMGNVQRKERTAAAFQVPIAPIAAPMPSAIQFAGKTAHFEDVGSILSAPYRSL
ncbi:hypothetical protein B0H17DRAFT_1135600, partial [Mycena rosella]